MINLKEGTMLIVEEGDEYTAQFKAFNIMHNIIHTQGDSLSQLDFIIKSNRKDYIIRWIRAMIQASVIAFLLMYCSIGFKILGVILILGMPCIINELQVIDYSIKYAEAYRAFKEMSDNALFEAKRIYKEKEYTDPKYIDEMYDSLFADIVSKSKYSLFHRSNKWNSFTWFTSSTNI